MGLICSRIGNAVTNHVGGSALPLDPGRMRGSRVGPVGNWQRWNNEFFSMPVGRNDQYALLMPMEYGGMAVDFVGLNALSVNFDLLLDMAADMVGSNTTQVQPFGATILWDAVCAMTGANTMTVAPDIILDMACAMLVNQLTQGDVEGATLDAEVEPGVTLRAAIKALLAVAAGKTTINDLGGGNAEVIFRDVNDTKDRITAEMDGSERTNITLDLT